VVPLWQWKQAEEFSTGISNKMIQNKNFFTVPSASHENLRNSNNIQNHALQNINGFSFKDTIYLLVSMFH
jgi:hypothetical protein